MEQSSPCPEIIQHQFERLCKKSLKGEAIDYYRHMKYLNKHEKLFSELSENELNTLFILDEYSIHHSNFQVLGYDIEVRDALIAEALRELTEKKRNVILLSYFMEMSDAEIARKLKIVRSTVCEHRKRSLELLKNIMEDSVDENDW